MSKITNPPDGQPKFTAQQIKENKHVQHLHRVYGRDDHDRNESQRYVMQLFQNVLELPVFGRGQNGQFCDTSAKLTEGQRILAKSILEDVAKPPVGNVTKPEVTK